MNKLLKSREGMKVLTEQELIGVKTVEHQLKCFRFLLSIESLTKHFVGSLHFQDTKQITI